MILILLLLGCKAHIFQNNIYNFEQHFQGTNLNNWYMISKDILKQVLASNFVFKKMFP